MDFWFHLICLETGLSLYIFFYLVDKKDYLFFMLHQNKYCRVQARSQDCIKMGLPQEAVISVLSEKSKSQGKLISFFLMFCFETHKPTRAVFENRLDNTKLELFKITSFAKKKETLFS